jgi:hypothetical protein
MYKKLRTQLENRRTGLHFYFPTFLVILTVPFQGSCGVEISETTVHVQQEKAMQKAHKQLITAKENHTDFNLQPKEQ